MYIGKPKIRSVPQVFYGFATGPSSIAPMSYGQERLGLGQLQRSRLPTAKYRVSRFRRGSKRLRSRHIKRLRWIARKTVDRTEILLRRLSPNQRVLLDIEMEGHVDAATDPTPYGTLDNERATAVSEYLDKQISNFSNRKGIELRVGTLTRFKNAGPGKPISSKYPANNRRVEIRIRWRIENKP